MNLCFVSDCDPLARPIGGMAIYTQNVAQALAAREHAVHVVVPRRDESRNLADGAVHPVQVSGWSKRPPGS